MGKNLPAHSVPDSLRTWFVVHFVLDFIFAVPLLLAPERVMPLIGWNAVDPITSRLVGAALMGIGVESLLGRKASLETYRAMLNLKIIWAASAVVGISLGLAAGGPPAAWVFLGIFAAFLGLWGYYRNLLR
ncbi:MAG TPA: hypothetical protein VLA49_05860 [Anaerolineales bacterium]|nr:hypothetical protein [Anaerolineales bacterium]